MPDRGRDVRAILRAEQKVRAVLDEQPTAAERFAARLASARALWTLAGIVLLWAVIDHWLGLDPFPFRWLQRVAILAGSIAVYVNARASNARHARALRRMRAQQELVEAITAAHPDDETKH